MPVQILPPKDDWGSQLGRILGTGIGSGMDRYQQVGGLGKLLGGTPEAYQQAKGIASLPPQAQGQVVKKMLEQSMWNKLFPSSQQEEVSPAQQPGGQPSPTQPAQPQEEMFGDETTRKMIQSGMIRPSEALQQKTAQDALAFKKLSGIHKMQEKSVNEVQEKGEAARELKRSYEAFDELNRSGKLPAKELVLGLKAFGASEDAIGKYLQNPSAQLWSKISATTLKFLKPMIGTSRLTDLQVEKFLEMFPQLSNTQEGSQLIIDGQQLLLQEMVIRDELQDKIMESNQGFAPANTRGTLNKIMRPIQDKISKQFRAIAKRAATLGAKG